MPKIEVFRETLYEYMGSRIADDEIEGLLSVAKAELDGIDEREDLLKIELNDTNRPDLWSTAGLARQLKSYRNTAASSDELAAIGAGQGAGHGTVANRYEFFSTPAEPKSCDRWIDVDENIRPHRPYVAAFGVSGRKIDSVLLKDLIQTQEKLCWNFGQKRRSIAMGIYRDDLISYPVTYRGADPESTRFVPLQMNRNMSLREILSAHPKGREFGSIIASFPIFPLLQDDNGEVLSMPPIINSERIGAVEVGDERLFVEMTGTDLRALLLAVSIVACDLADTGHTITPIETRYPFDTEFGTRVASPFYFQDPVNVEADDIERMLGVSLTKSEVSTALARMGLDSTESHGVHTVKVPAYRNDFLHSVDIIEDIMIGRGMQDFDPIMPSEFTAGRLTPEEAFGRSVKDIMVGLRFQEMIYNYLGSGRDFITRMCISSDDLVQIANPMSENYEFIRNSILPALLGSEAVSAHAVYPHAMFEVGKIARRDAHDNHGSVTRNNLGFLVADRSVGFNEVSAHVQVLFYYLNFDYSVSEDEDPRFIPGRCARIVCDSAVVGVFGEIHPQVLENWSIQMPCAAVEIDLDKLHALRSSR